MRVHLPPSFYGDFCCCDWHKIWFAFSQQYEEISVKIRQKRQ